VKMNDVSVMVVEDSPVARELITNTVNADPRLRVVCAVDTAEKALRLLPGIAPDVISMDIRLPGMNGIEATRQIMERCPTPIVVVAADCRNDTVKVSMEALRAGALTVVEKPSIESAESYGAMSRRLCDQFVNMSKVRVVRQRFNGTRPHSTERRRQTAKQPVRARPVMDSPDSAIEVIGVVASTGGPAAIARLLQGLSPAFPVPILVVQHMAGNFLEGYAAWLDSVCGLEVGLARDTEKAVPARVYVAPGECDLIYRAGRIRLITSQRSAGHSPSGDALFGSLADLGPRAIGILLTGMGDDGARGLLEMHNSGARTLAQDKESSAVYGMPAAACALGAVNEQLPICSIAGRLTHLVAAEARAAR